jgi:hypothetical protein
MAGNARSWGSAIVLSARGLSTSTATPATTLDLASYASLAKREMKVSVVLAGLAGTTVSVLPAVEECATTNGTWTTPAQYTAASAQTTNGLVELNFRADLRYIRLPVTLGANTTGADVHAVAFAMKREANS